MSGTGLERPTECVCTDAEASLQRLKRFVAMKRLLTIAQQVLLLRCLAEHDSDQIKASFAESGVMCRTEGCDPWTSA